MRLLSKLILAAILSLSLAPIVSACPLCKDSIPEAEDGAEIDHDPDRLSAGYNYSIYAMLLVPFALCSSVGVVIYRSSRPVLANRKE
jgi:hypothetical protein